jgi:hypothetical protein
MRLDSASNRSASTSGRPLYGKLFTHEIEASVERDRVCVRCADSAASPLFTAVVHCHGVAIKVREGERSAEGTVERRHQDPDIRRFQRVM